MFERGVMDWEREVREERMLEEDVKDWARDVKEVKEVKEVKDWRHSLLPPSFIVSLSLFLSTCGA